MAATPHELAHSLAKPGKEETLKTVHSAFIARSRLKIDLHEDTDHWKAAIVQVKGLVEVPPNIRRYRLV